MLDLNASEMPASAYESRKNPLQVLSSTARDSYASEKRLGVLSKLRKKLESRGAGFVEEKDLESLDMRFALLGSRVKRAPANEDGGFLASPER